MGRLGALGAALERGTAARNDSLESLIAPKVRHHHKVVGRGVQTQAPMGAALQRAVHTIVTNKVGGDQVLWVVWVCVVALQGRSLAAAQPTGVAPPARARGCSPPRWAAAHLPLSG